MLRLAGILHQHEAARLLYRPHAVRAVGPGAGKHDGEGVVVLGGQRAEKQIDRKPLAPWLVEACRRDFMVGEDEGPIRRDDVDVVRLERHRSVDGGYRHAGARAEDAAEFAVHPRREVEDDDVGQTQVLGDMAEERLQGRKAARRRPDAHDPRLQGRRRFRAPRLAGPFCHRLAT